MEPEVRWPYRVELLLPGGMKPLVAQHLEWLRVRGYAKTTIIQQEMAVCQLVHWLGGRGITHPTEVSKPILERYQAWLFHYRKRNGEPLSSHSQNQRLLCIMSFFRWLSRENVIASNPAGDLELPRTNRSLPKNILSAQEMELVLQRPDVGTVLGLRDRAILETFYSTGMRRMELSGLSVWDLNRSGGTVMIRNGKGQKDRVVPIGGRAIAWVDKYMDEARPELVMEPDEGILFLTRMGGPMSLRWLTSMAQGYIRESGVKKAGSCHLFRHTAATLMLEGGADVRYIQQLLGHATILSTQVYTQVSITKLKQVHDRTHPGARLTPRQDPARSLDLDSDDLLISLAAEAAEECEEPELSPIEPAPSGPLKSFSKFVEAVGMWATGVPGTGWLSKVGGQGVGSRCPRTGISTASPDEAGRNPHED